MNRLTELDIHRLRVTLCDIKRRCYNKNNKFYKDYGARGITVCNEWLNSKTGHTDFRTWAIENGYKHGLSIDRIDNNQGYSPDNCRWATPKEQANNRRTNNYLKIGNTIKTITEWSEIFKFSSDLAIKRYNKGFNIDKIFEIPKTSTKKKAVIRLSDLKEYNSLCDAAKDIDGIPDKIALVCRGEREHHKGYKFVFKEDAQCWKIN